MEVSAGEKYLMDRILGVTLRSPQDTYLLIVVRLHQPYLEGYSR
jgi:hypothetical protein